MLNRSINRSTKESARLGVCAGLLRMAQGTAAPHPRCMQSSSHQSLRTLSRSFKPFVGPQAISARYVTTPTIASDHTPSPHFNFAAATICSLSSQSFLPISSSCDAAVDGLMLQSAGTQEQKLVVHDCCMMAQVCTAAVFETIAVFNI